MLMQLSIRLGRYAPGHLVSPKTEALFWTPVARDKQGNETGELVCNDAVELRFTRPAASANFHIAIRSQLVDGVGDEWTVVLPADRMGILFIPQGFTAEQSIMGAVYRLNEPRQIRLLADQIAGMPGINFTIQLLS